jgi:hypothetical protein
MSVEPRKVTVASLTAMLLRDRALARQNHNPQRAIDAVMLIAKLHGLLVERQQIKVECNLREL